MKRIHLFEFEDLKWFPSSLRNYGTDFLQFLSNITKLYKPIVPLLEEVIEREGSNQIIDLGSGGGGGWIWLSKELQKTQPELKITLTDYYPNLKAFEYNQKKIGNLKYITESIDARDVPEDLKGVRTQFLSLHHFRPNDAKKILQNAVDAKQAVAIFEAQERGFLSFLAMVFSPLNVVLLTPFIFPLKLGRLVFTYLIPIVPKFVMWDGIVSALRTYSVKEMNGLIDELENKETYDWKVGRIRSGPGVILYLIGIEKNTENSVKEMN